MRPSIRIALFLASLAALLATATPVAADEGHGAVEGAPTLTELVRAEPVARARAVDAHLIAEWHERHGHHRWHRGRGDWGHTWSTYRVQAGKLRAYLRSEHEALRRFALVVSWARVAQCESSGNWSIDTGNGYYGGLQFSIGTWRAYGGQGAPQRQPAWYQAQIADNVRTRSGLHHWPVCGRLYR